MNFHLILHSQSSYHAARHFQAQWCTVNVPVQWRWAPHFRVTPLEFYQKTCPTLPLILMWRIISWTWLWGGRIWLQMVHQKILPNSHCQLSPPHDSKPLMPESIFVPHHSLRGALVYSQFCSLDNFQFNVDLDVHVEGETEYPMMLPPSLPSSQDRLGNRHLPRSWRTPITHFHAAHLSNNLLYSPSPLLMLMLKLRWLSPTISLIREEHERCGPPTKLRLYFGGGGMQGSKESKVCQTPMSMKTSVIPQTWWRVLLPPW